MIAILTAACGGVRIDRSPGSARVITAAQVNQGEIEATPSPQHLMVKDLPARTRDPDLEKTIVIPAVIQTQLTQTPGLPEQSQLAPANTILLPTPPPISIDPAEVCSPLQSDTLMELPKIVSDPYHPPPPGHEERHHGVDFSYYRHKDKLTIQGVVIQSILPGRVAMSMADKFPYGNVVIVETPRDFLSQDLIERLKIGESESLYILYAHMDQRPEVNLGDEVSICQTLGQVGKSGNAGVSHLHIETRIGPAVSNFESMSYYVLDATPEERKTYVLWRTSGRYRHFNPMDLLTGS